MELIFTLEDIEDAAKTFVHSIKGRMVIAFHGEMGAGKTTFVQAICKILKVKNTVSSPTFSIINEYVFTEGNVLYHLDLYRLKNIGEAIEAGVEECLNSGNLCFVEWPENAPALFPPETVHCYLKRLTHKQRKLQINL